MTSTPQSYKASTVATRGSWILALALVASPGAWAQQDQPPPPPDSQQQQQNQQDTHGQPPQATPQDQQAPNPNPPTPRKRRVLSTDRLPSAQPQDGQQPEGQAPDDQQQGGSPQGNKPYRNGQQDTRRITPARPVPDTLTLPQSTVINIRTNEPLSSDHSKKGDHFTATLQQPLVVNGFVVARRGQTIEGEVEGAQKAGRVKGVSQLALRLTDVSLVDGQSIPIDTELWQGTGGTSHGADAATIATTTGVGAAIGAAANLGTGAAVGAGAGLLAGIGAVLLTRGRPTIIPPETELTFRLTEPLTINTTDNKQAFQLLRQDDFGNGRGGRRPGGPYAAGYPPPYPCGPYGPCVVGPPVYYGYYGPYFYGRPWGWRRW